MTQDTQRFRLLGPITVDGESGPLPLGGPKQRTVLAVLLLNANRVVAEANLIQLTWGDAPPAGVRGQLQLYVSRLRKLLGGQVIVRRPPGYQIEVRPGELDLHDFDDKVARARVDLAAGRTDEASGRLRDALALCRGAVLGGACEPLVEREGAVLRERRLSALEEYFEAELALGRPHHIIGDLRRAAAEEPFRERFQAQLMLALHGCGRSHEALQVYSAVRGRLAGELGIDPGRPLQEMQLRILQDDGFGNGSAQAAPVLLAAASAGPVPAAPTVPRQLPADVAAFAGRAPELAHLDSLLPSDGVRPAAAVVITTISGGAGVGKTALAVHWAHRVRERFPDGQLYVNLRGFHPNGPAMTVAAAVRGFLDALQVPGSPIPDSLEAQTSLYRSLLAERRMLILLDNARTVEQVRPLLPGSPRCMVVVTSRHRLSSLVAVEAADVLPLGLLSSAEAGDLLARRLGAGRVTAEPGAVDEIIARCSRLPLALSIVAARAATNPGFTLAMLAGELHQTSGGLDAFHAGDAATDVRTVMSWSYRILSTDTARLFRLLGVHGGPDIAAAAAAALAGVPAPVVRSQLAELADANLVAEHAPGRYGVHDLLRAYASELAHTQDSEPERRAALHRQLDYYLHTGHAAALLLNPHRDPITLAPGQPGAGPEHLAGHEPAIAWFTSEHAAMVAAVGQAAAAGFHTHTWQLAWTLVNFFARRGHWHDAATTQRAALTAACRLADPAAQAIAHSGLASACAYLRLHDEAQRHYQQALELFAGLGDHAGQVHIHRGLAWALGRQSRHAEALYHAQQALKLSLDDPAAHASALNAVGWYHAQLGDHRASLAHCRQALEMLQRSGDHWGQANTWDSLGYVYRQLGDDEQAAACYREALDRYRTLGDRYPESRMLLHLGDIQQAAGQLEAARCSWQDALHILEELDHPDAEQVRAKLRRQARNPAPPGRRSTVLGRDA